MVARTARLVAAILAGGTFALTACYTAPPQSPPSTKVTVTTTSQQTAPQSQGKYEQLVAPIALFPDALLAQILMASTYPLEVVEAARWSAANPKIQGTALEDALQSQNWDPSVKSLTAFPQVLKMMNEKLSWMQQLGDAFLADHQGVMNAVQALRRAAYEQGNLMSGTEHNVIVEQGATPSEKVIKLEPASSTVVYVPAYDPTIVYGTWPYPAYPPYYYYPPGYYAGAAFWGFTAGVIVGSALWGGCDWHGGDVYVDHRNYNNFNRTNISGNRNWNHNVEHRRGVAYRDQNVANRYNRPGASTRDMQARQQFHGRAEAGRSELGQRLDGGNRINRNDPSRGGADNRDLGSASRDFGGGRDFSGGRPASSFGGVDSGSRASDFGSRGASSRGSSFGGGGFSRGGFRGGGRGRR